MDTFLFSSRNPITIQNGEFYYYSVSIICAVLTTTTVIGLIGNSFLIYTLRSGTNRKRERIRSDNDGFHASSLLVLNLSWLEIASLLNTILTLFYFAQEEWIFGTFVCKIYLPFREFKPLLSSILLFWVAVDSIKKIEEGPCIAVIILSWTVACVYLLRHVLSTEIAATVSGIDRCTLQPGFDKELNVYVCIISVFPFLLMSLITVSLICLKMYAVVNGLLKMSKSDKQNHDCCAIQSERLALPLALVLSQLICLTPHSFYQIWTFCPGMSRYWQLFQQYEKIFLIIKVLEECLIGVNSAFQPLLVFVLANPKGRRRTS